ncbi:caspase family protein [Methylovirgula sp. HY1]|uniref:caspase family protein n=1 Tax=Methylovirgula sp. HY1 TaxID=2822761 RepID=UPI001C5B451E|nr:caspase family protein [Methylovirgula sp. HY1]QXX73822.1 hypothetical protein MHY1_00623 [Methylovirgula sp. HY1]
MFSFLQKFIAHLLVLVLAFFHPGSAHVGAAQAIQAPPHVQEQPMRLALVIGNANYANMPVATAANDAGLVAQTLQTAGFDVTAGADLDLDALRRAFRDFLDKAQQAGPGSVLFVYLAGRALQYSGDNFFLPIDARIDRDVDVPLSALRLSDYRQALAALPVMARIFVVDGARAVDPIIRGKLASGLALVEPAPGALEAFNAAPGTIAPDEPGPYGAYARALVEMMQQGLPVNEVFARARLRVNELTRGAVVPWDISRIDTPFYFFVRQQSAPPLQSLSSYESRPLRTFAPADAYEIVVERDSIEGYEDYLAAFPTDPLTPRVRALLAARREALSWRRAYVANTPDAYWSYMRRYPRGPHYWDARRRLMMLRAALEPPRHFDSYDFGGLPPPPEDEYGVVDRPVMRFDDAGFAPLPFLPAFLLPVQPEEFRRMPPPPRAERGRVPIPAPLSAPHAMPAKPMGAIAQPNFGHQGIGGPAQGAAPGGPRRGHHDSNSVVPVAPMAPNPAHPNGRQGPAGAAPAATAPMIEHGAARTGRGNPPSAGVGPAAKTPDVKTPAVKTPEVKHPGLAKPTPPQAAEPGHPAAIQPTKPVVGKPLPVQSEPVKPLTARPSSPVPHEAGAPKPVLPRAAPSKPIPQRPVIPLAPPKPAATKAPPPKMVPAARIAPPKPIPPRPAPTRPAPPRPVPARPAPPRIVAPPKATPIKPPPPKPVPAKPGIVGKPAAGKPVGKAEKKLPEAK